HLRPLGRPAVLRCRTSLREPDRSRHDRDRSGGRENPATTPPPPTARICVPAGGYRVCGAEPSDRKRLGGPTLAAGRELIGDRVLEMRFELEQQAAACAPRAFERGVERAQPIGTRSLPGHAPSRTEPMLREKISQSRRRPSSAFAPFAVSSYTRLRRPSTSLHPLRRRPSASSL